ncbi:GIY-YIG nuclease family protein [Dellaglioa sp. BT-FLS60]
MNKEIKHYKNVITELQEKLLTADESEKNSLKLQLSELQQQIDTHEKDKEALDYRLQNTTAGYVYIISNIGSFGKDIVKIGVTRRLEPLDRIAEPSSASVPYKFDIHALIFSYDAYQLESDLHHKFSNQRINKVNSRKEFFNIPIEDIKAALTNYKDLTVDFEEVPVAEEYRESLAISAIK